MKTIKRSTLRELTRLTRKRVRNGGVDTLDKITEVCRTLAKQAYDTVYAWTPFYDIASSVLGGYPLKPDCTDEEFEELFKWLGFEIEEENDGDKTDL